MDTYDKEYSKEIAYGMYEVFEKSEGFAEIEYIWQCSFCNSIHHLKINKDKITAYSIEVEGGSLGWVDICDNAKQYIDENTREFKLWKTIREVKEKKG